MYSVFDWIKFPDDIFLGYGIVDRSMPYLILASWNKTLRRTTGSNFTNASLSGFRDTFLRVV